MSSGLVHRATSTMRRLAALAREGGRLLRAIGHTLAWALRPRSPAPALAVLEGQPFARAGTPSGYRVRVYNPTRRHQRLAVSVRGWRGDDLDFELRWDVTLEPGAGLERWICSTWNGGGARFACIQPPASPAWEAEAGERWTIEALLFDSRGLECDRLRISGALA